MITLLQHTHLSLPHYDDKEWDWLRGALCTVDRSYGRFLNVMHHHIADTHVAHHLFSQVRSHAKDVTEFPRNQMILSIFACVMVIFQGVSLDNAACLARHGVR